MPRTASDRKLHVYTVRITDKMFTAIKALAHETGLSQQELLRRGIEQYLASQTLAPAAVQAVKEEDIQKERTARRKGLARPRS